MVGDELEIDIDSFKTGQIADDFLSEYPDTTRWRIRGSITTDNSDYAPLI